ncbi:DNA polymerase III subunit delta' [Caulobacter sp. FWC2]|uniref:DNA polymerase III subunit delta' n=1 Tax=Caulobacter sp. FWC2 TaxID=69664 RepID=UPI000C1610F5|nr:DNA polymerase III subunit delta' [Caulobacter sp. FWC2]PIB92179.1 DNA polymerase III subunit delta' [Caulobacter sp. FWC2]
MNPAHPRDVYGLDGQSAAEASFLDALDRGRLHHAWLLTGPEGVGKATLAYRMARRLLGAKPEPSMGLLGAAPSDVVSRQVAARSHPDLMVLERLTDDGKARKSIPVDEARRLPEFFANSPAVSPYRVAIIDAADDLNVNAANAVLKTLEEPPPRGVILLISHAPGKLLPTIRSRCRRLVVPAPGVRAAAEMVERMADVSERDAERLARMAHGAPGKALQLAAAKAIEMDDAANEILRGLPKLDEGALLALTDTFRGGEGAARFELLMERMADQVRIFATQVAADGKNSPGLDRWAAVWERLSNVPGEAEAVNLDRADVFWSVISDLRAAAKTAI